MSDVALTNLRVDGPQGVLINGVDLSVGQGEVLGLVGSSGAGKTLIASALAGLTPPPANVVGGKLRLGGKNYSLADKKQMATARGPGVFMIMQSASAALDPTMRISGQLTEALTLDSRKRSWAAEKAVKILADVGLSHEIMNYFPGQLSGGMRQRVQIAIALAMGPSLLIADEPTTGLDAITQASILKVLAELPRQTGCSMIFISHDLKIVASLAENIAVLDHGAVIEQGRSKTVLQGPQHHITRQLVEAAID